MNRKCPFCLWPLKATETVVACPYCAAQYHAECYDENDLTCATFGCAAWATATEPVPVSGEELARTGSEELSAPVDSELRINLDQDDLIEPTFAAPQTFEADPGGVAYCSQCGTRIGASDSFCFSCGNSLAETA